MNPAWFFFMNHKINELLVTQLFKRVLVVMSPKRYYFIFQPIGAYLLNSIHFLLAFSNACLKNIPSDARTHSVAKEFRIETIYKCGKNGKYQ